MFTKIVFFKADCEIYKQSDEILVFFKDQE